MSEFRQALNTHVNEADWKRMANASGLSVTALKKKIVPALEAEAKGYAQGMALTAVAGPTLKLTAVRKKADCASQKFEISLFKIIGLSGELTVCGTNATNWTAKLQFCLIVAGAKVWCTTYTFDPHNVRVCYSPDVGFAKADLCFTLQIGSGKLCLNIRGKACVWGLGWRCGDFDVTPFCIPLP